MKYKLETQFTLNSKALLGLKETPNPIASQVLIDEAGQNVWEFHDVLAAAGFPVSCGERDRFGWLTAVIQTKKGQLIYG